MSNYSPIAVISNSAGVEIGSLLSTSANQIDQLALITSDIDDSNSTSTPLISGQLWSSSTMMDLKDYAGLIITFLSNKASDPTYGLSVTWSSNGSNEDFTERSIVTSDGSNARIVMVTNKKARYGRVTYQNGPVAQGYMRLSTLKSRIPLEESKYDNTNYHQFDPSKATASNQQLIISDLDDLVGGITATQLSVSASATDVQLLLPDSTRLGATITNDSGADLYVSFGNGVATITNYAVLIPSSGYYEVPDRFSKLNIRGIWSSATGAARIATVSQ